MRIEELSMDFMADVGSKLEGLSRVLGEAEPVFNWVEQFTDSGQHDSKFW